MKVKHWTKIEKKKKNLKSDKIENWTKLKSGEKIGQNEKLDKNWINWKLKIGQNWKLKSGQNWKLDQKSQNEN